MSSQSCSGSNSIHCQNCSMADLCIPFTLNDTEMGQLDNIIERKKPIQKGELICSAGEPLSSLYAIRSGSFKSYIITPDGHEQVTSFNLAGDIVGFDSIGREIHQSFAVALETSMVCEIPFDTVDQLSGRMPRLRQQMLRLMSDEILNDQTMLMLLSKRSAEERLATFIDSLGDRHGERGLSSKEFRLTMTRGDIGNYLGLTVETISRLLGRFQKNNLIEVQGKYITIVDKQALAQLSGVTTSS
ncbi:fumarate/nitrate reduction transcriptional regulator Fnr [Psychrobium sp. 1_MG-2023]|uniref:fumarate/nitrate reduction transcriptional regulator Fnr n=1 Tax=Psychrobium sp. 1_MG-2023 TaxID=3062624 RepID=UPI000C31D175|nr:fumarate/nitrate reduction transcriptional regulator Fnr [Psychrobium sp. 1_MG-2023]MDP2561543.1 fumarate/nitrate reduction transcriptional regulator Fnr [Psychrobium sp. 1_MG-2023]PKF55006.1 transcriptional regulator FNR [Alteromonadales bacterium alter-6D02]